MAKCVVSVMLVAVLVVAGSLAGCYGSVTGSGNLDTEERYFGGFTRVKVSGAFEVEIIQSSGYNVSVTADDNLLKYVKVSQSGETLKIGVSTGDYNFTALEASVSMPDLYGLNLSGATDGIVRGFNLPNDFSVELSGASSLYMSDISAGGVKFDLSGASSLNMHGMSARDVDFDISEASSLDVRDMSVGDARFDLSGASSIRLEGSANDIVIDASGASDVRLDDFSVNNVDITLRDASSGIVNLDGKLDAELSGASELRYVGEPTMGDIDISDVSAMNKR